jgi:pimeloyl-ACP methyl ester carboxylesterase/predicted glycosyltransferase
MTVAQTRAAPRGQTRARYPDEEGHVERDGVRVFWERYGEGRPTVFLLPTWSIVHSRFWKAQVPYLARHFRVVTFDGRGNGRSDRPARAEAYTEREFAADALAVLDATATRRAVLVSLSCGALWSTLMAAEHPDRVAGCVYLGPAVGLAPPHPERAVHSFLEPLDTEEGWARYNQHYWLRDYRGFLEYFFSRCLIEPHSTKQREDCVGWALETAPETLIATELGLLLCELESFERQCRRVRCPTLVIHGSEDAIRPHAQGSALAAATRGRLVTLAGSGHLLQARDPVKVNLLIREFVESLGGWPDDDRADHRPGAAPGPPSTPSGVRDPVKVSTLVADVAGVGPAATARTWTRALRRPRRALYLSSPIGLGHARRDVAIARELRRLHPGLEIDWLAQDPVTRVLEAEGERVHPASAWLANESAHIEAESATHDLHAFQAIRRMDEILVANFMVFSDVVAEEPYDLWVGDEAWELDYFLHENPEHKRAAYVWLTDFVGWLPMADGGEREAFLTADYNAEMIAHIARFPRLRDRAIFVGNPDDIVADSFGPGLPPIREWVEGHYDFAGYVTGFDPAAVGDRDELRRRLGYGPDERVCVVTVGGSGVGGHLLGRVIDAYPEASRRVPGLRMVVVAGPRIDPASLPQQEGLEVHAYVHGLYRHLAACDLAVVQGGLTTCMELTAAGRPFLFFPLAHHFEQNYHVAHRLDRYHAGRRMDFATATPEVIAAAIADELGRPVDYRPVETDGATRAASLIAELL